MTVQAIHADHFARSSFLSSFQVANAILPKDVVTILNRNKISFVLVGAYGLSGWRKEPRGTEDVDVVVAAKQVKKATRLLLKVFPNLEAVEFPVVVRLRDRLTQMVAIDLMKPAQQPYREVFKHTKEITAEGVTYRVPSLEMAVTMKFSAMTSSYRQTEDKYQDAHDFILMVKNNPELDRGKVTELASLLYPEGGKDVQELITQALAGKKLVF